MLLCVIKIENEGYFSLDIICSYEYVLIFLRVGLLEPGTNSLGFFLAVHPRGRVRLPAVILTDALSADLVLFH